MFLVDCLYPRGKFTVYSFQKKKIYKIHRKQRPLSTFPFSYFIKSTHNGNNNWHSFRQHFLWKEKKILIKTSLLKTSLWFFIWKRKFQREFHLEFHFQLIRRLFLFLASLHFTPENVEAELITIQQYHWNEPKCHPSIQCVFFFFNF